MRLAFLVLALVALPAAAGEWERVLDGRTLLLGWGSAESRREALALLLRRAGPAPVTLRAAPAGDHP